MKQISSATPIYSFCQFASKTKQHTRKQVTILKSYDATSD